MTTRVLTVRLPEEQVVALETVASFDGVALAEELREGVKLLLAARRNDPEFHARVQQAFENARQMLEGVEGADAVIEALRPAVEAAEVAQQDHNAALVAEQELAERVGMEAAAS